jgi:hypothetical protein
MMARNRYENEITSLQSLLNASKTRRLQKTATPESRFTSAAKSRKGGERHLSYFNRRPHILNFEEDAAMDESGEVDEFTGYRLDGKVKPLTRSAVWIRASIGLVTLILTAIIHRDAIVQIARGFYRFLERSAAALWG